MTNNYEEIKDEINDLKDELRSIEDEISSLDPLKDEDEIDRLEDERDDLRRKIRRLGRQIRSMRRDAWREEVHSHVKRRSHGSGFLGDIEGFLEDLGETIGETMEGVARNIELSLDGIPFISPFTFTHRKRKHPFKYHNHFQRDPYRRVKIHIPEEKIDEFCEKSAQLFDELGDRLGLKILTVLSKHPKTLDELKEVLEANEQDLNTLLGKYDEAGFIVHEVVKNRYLITSTGYKALVLAYRLFKAQRKEEEIRTEYDDEPRRGLKIQIEQQSNEKSKNEKSDFNDPEGEFE